MVGLTALSDMHFSSKTHFSSQQPSHTNTHKPKHNTDTHRDTTEKDTHTHALKSTKEKEGSFPGIFPELGDHIYPRTNSGDLFNEDFTMAPFNCSNAAGVHAKMPGCPPSPRLGFPSTTHRDGAGVSPQCTHCFPVCASVPACQVHSSSLIA